MLNYFRRFAQDESGATAIEYGLIAALIAVAIIAALNLLAGNLKNTFNYVGTQLAGATTN
jgi:pilus assembly protein Flp/PilA